MIVIAPFAQKLRNGKYNPKNWPLINWQELVSRIGSTGEPIVQVGVESEPQLVPDFRKNLTLVELRKLIREARTWVAVDSFFQHLAWDEGRPGIVLFGQSDPDIFGHPLNTNLVKDRCYLRTNQFLTWEQCEYNPLAFVSSETVFNHLKEIK